MYSLGHIPCFAKDTKHLLEGPKGSAIQSAQPAVDSRDSRPHCHSNSHVLAIWQIPLMSGALQYINLHYAEKFRQILYLKMFHVDQIEYNITYMLF